LWSVHQQDRAALAVELPPALEDNALNTRDFYSSVSSDIQPLDLERVDLIILNPWFLNGRILAGDLCDVVVGVYVSVNRQFACLFVDCAEITRPDCFGRVPIRPLCDRLVNQVDVLALSILLYSLYVRRLMLDRNGRFKLYLVIAQQQRRP